MIDYKKKMTVGKAKKILRGFLEKHCYKETPLYYAILYLLNHITILQERDKEWSMIFDTFSKRPYAHKYLEQKKKELGNKNIIGLDSEMVYKDYYDLQEEIERQSKAQVILDNQIIEMSEYKSKNEKAIEIFKRAFDYKDSISTNNWEYDGGREEYIGMLESAYNTLQGSDNSD